MKKKIIAGVSIIAVIAVVYLITRGENESIYTFAKVGRENVTQTVSVTGTVEADPRIDMQFQKNGKIQTVYVAEGEEVKKGQILSELDNRDLKIQIEAAAANLIYNQAKLEQTLAGSTNEQVEIARVSLNQANTDLTNAENAYADLRTLNKEKVGTQILAVTQAELNLKKAESDLEYTKSIAEQNIKDAEFVLQKAEKDLENSETGKVNTDTTYEQNLQNAYNDIVPKMDDGLLADAQNLEAIDDILGLTNPTIVPGTVNLAAKNPALLTNAQESYNTGKQAYESAKTKHNVWVGTKDPETLESVVNEILNSLDEVKIALDDAYKVLENSTTEGESGTSNPLKIFTDLILTQTANNHTATKNLQTGYQNILDAKIAKESQSHTSKTSKDSYEIAYEQAKENLETVKIQNKNTIDNAELMVETRQIELKQAQQNLKELQANTQKQENDALALIEIKKIAVQNAQANLNSVTAPPREVDLKSLRANVSKAESDLQTAQYNLDQTQIKAPIDGVVVDITKDIGENITAQEIFIVINSPQLLIKSNVSETDIAKVKIGDLVELTFDAFDFSEQFIGEVVDISTGETVIDGVIYYQIKSSFITNNGEEIRSGMTANLKIITAKKEDVLAIPIRAIKYEGNERFVQYVEGGELKQKPVKIGIEGDQFVEITEGVEEGEEIVTFVKYEYTL